MTLVHHGPVDSHKMPKSFNIDDHMRWNSEAGRVSGTIVAIDTGNVECKGHMHRASPENPPYEIKSDRTDHIAAHKKSTPERRRGKSKT